MAVYFFVFFFQNIWVFFFLCIKYTYDNNITSVPISVVEYHNIIDGDGCTFVLAARRRSFRRTEF